MNRNTVFLALGLSLASATAAWADNGIAKCRDGQLGMGPSSGAGAFCESHGGLESWTALLASGSGSGTGMGRPQTATAQPYLDNGRPAPRMQSGTHQPAPRAQATE